jgi:hypothetical protein
VRDGKKWSGWSLAIVENSMIGKKTQPTLGELRRLASQIGQGISS